MSSDASPPGGSRLEADPPWFRVIGTTLHLLLRRHLLWISDHYPVSGTRLAASFVAVVVVAAAASSAAVALSSARHHPVAGRPAHHATTPPLMLARAEAKANVRDAMAWMAAQVTTQVVIGCDPATCAQLEAAGFTTYVRLTGQAALKQAATNQAIGVPGTIALVVATPAVRAMYGAQVAANAPAVLASFGTGPVAVQVRELTPGGSAAYPSVARRALAVRRKAGLSLIRNGQVHVHGPARLALTAGFVDQRLTWLLGRIAARYPVNVARFGDSGPHAGRSAPLRMAEIGGFVLWHGSQHVGDLATIMKLLRAQPQPYLEELTVIHLLGGTVMVKIVLRAPTPL
ncbi:MAG: hypothetical protein ACLQFR_19770 [Streptosporangiaceae bacterium]